MNTKKEKLLYDTYQSFIDQCLGRIRPDALNEILSEDAMGFGTTADEKIFCIEDFLKLLRIQKEQSEGLGMNWEIEPISRYVNSDENLAVFADDLHLTVDVNGEKIKMYVRISIVLEYTNNKWIVIHWHGSKPEEVQSEEDTFGIENWKQKVEKLEKIVAERTADLVEKNRELEIEAALEKVRSRTMAMQKSDELADAAAILFQQVRKLGIETYTSGFNIWNEENNTLDSWMSNPTGVMNPNFIMPIDKYGQHKRFYEAWKNNIEFLEDDLTGKKLNGHYKYLRSFPLMEKAFATSEKAGIKTPNRQVHNAVFFSCGYVLFVTLEPNSQNHDVFKRFGKVFEQTYTRFIDLQKAEAQAREAEIELALERVRARTMAMHQSNELAETALLLFQQLQALGLSFSRTGFYIWQNGVDLVEGWTSNGALNEILPSLLLPYKEDKGHLSIYEASLKGELSYEQVLTGEELDKHYQWLLSQPSVPGTLRKSKNSEFIRLGKQYKYAAIFKQGYLLMISTEPEANANDLLKRFAKVFEQAYTRFLDLQKAEAQAREAKIEVSLERVRSRAMAMHKTDELLDAAELVYKELSSLGITSMAVSYAFINEQEKNALYYGINPVDGKIPPIPFVFPHAETDVMRSILSSWKKRETFNLIELDEKATLKHQTWVGEHIQSTFAKNNIPFSVEAFLAVSPQTAVVYSFNFTQGYLFVIGEERLSAMQEEILLRFTKVFEMTYRRFLDLQKAEAQAREAEIELALERVRARTMAMQHSDELLGTSKVVFDQLKNLGETTNQFSIGIIDEKEGVFDVFATIFGNQMIQVYHPKIDDPFVMGKVYKAWKEHQKSFVIKIKGKRLREYNITRNSIVEGMKVYPESIQPGDCWVVSCATFSAGIIAFSSDKETSNESIQLLERFAKVFEQTYTRFLDLQKAEAQARESQIQLGLERVRARAMAMQNSEELKELIGTVFTELTQLDLVLTRCVIWIFDPKTNGAIWWMANSEDPKNPINCDIPFNEYEPYLAFLEQWKKKAIKFQYELKDEIKKDWDKYLFSKTGLSNLPDFVVAGMKAPERVLLTASFNNFGAMNAASLDPLSDEHADILLRFAKVFDLTYTRFNDLKQAEAQARESQIQLALERVRARTMAMQKSAELSETVYILFQQFKELGENPDQATIGVINENEKVIEYWVTMNGNQINKVFKFPIDEPNVTNKIYKAWKANKKSLVIDLSGRALKEFMAYRAAKGGAAINPKEKRRIINVAFFSKGLLNVQSNEERSEESIKLLERFASVFEQTYTRFLDLQNAEAQVREVQIEASLEKVRSRSMGMQKSEELKEVIKVVYEQFVHLNINVEHTGFIIDYKERDDMHIWLADQHLVPSEIFIPYFDSAHWNSFNEAKGKGTDFFPTLLDFEEKNKFYKDLFVLIPGIPEETIDYYFRCPGLAGSTVLLDNVSLYIENFQGIPYTDEENNILMRFGKVFQQTYTRFLDLQKAEAQAREAQIEAALERTRTQSMIMQHSYELNDTLRVFHEQVLQLNIPSAFSFLWLPDEEKNKHLFWAIWEETKNEAIALKDKAINYPLDRNEPATAQCLIDWKSDEPVYSYAVQPEGVENYFATWHELIDGVEKLKPEFFPGGLHYVEAFMKYGCFGVMVENDLTEDEKKILYRFAVEFERTYARFLDLQKAEAQAREAKIEAALERVRSRTMAMQRSDELPEAANLLFQQIQALGIPAWSAGYCIWEDNKKAITLWMSSEGVLQPPARAPLTEDPSFIHMREAYEKGESFHVEAIGGDELVQHYQYMRTLPVVGDMLDSIIEAGHPLPTFQIFHCVYFSQGFLLFITYEPVHDAHDIFKRFGKVFDQTYTRFLDLQKAEAQAREAQVEAALEKVRSRTLAMQNSDELADTSIVIFEQLIHLGIEPNRLFIGIINNETAAIEAWATNEDGTKIGNHFTLNTQQNESVKKMYEGWKENKTSITIDMTGDELQDYFHYLSDEMHIPFKGGLSQKRRIQTIAYFGQGLIGMASPEDQPKETTQLLERFAAVFNLTYTRFNDLKIAEAHAVQAEEDLIKLQTEKRRAEDALTNLQAAQKQLVQSEKMASLGELTAGIAHEIQNPLNFVNNFSEVSKELLDEMKEEMEKGHLEDVKQIMQDVIQNLEKINLHGKRADGIVKGMLQHSQSSKGQKQSTDINALCDEYLRLSYHGLRAKDKSFNAKMKSDFDNTIGKINIVPQDIGRVILNLINNAFYAVNERLPQAPPDSQYEPTVSISTKKIGDKIEIKVRDNGNGIPKNIVDKIFQPFFTTKPTGQGTGLGLSLSYDIIKAHGGEIRVETKVGEGTEFVIEIPEQVK